MKMTKFFAALFAVAAMFAACDGPNNGGGGVIIGGEEDSTEVVLNIPTVAKPAAGQTTVVLFVPEDTPAGCYAVGSFDWNEKNTEKMFTAVEGADEGWVSYTFDWTEGLEFKVLAIPSDPDVAPGWSYQWGKNMDPDNDLEEDNVVILAGSVGGEFVLENQGQPKLTKLADGGVCYIHIKAWATTPVIEAKKAETAAFKHPWGGGEWIYREATKTADATFEINAIYGGNGVNVATDVTGAGENWYPTDQIEFVGDVANGDSVNFKFVSEKLAIGKMTITLIEKGQTEPVEYVSGTIKVTPWEGNADAINLYSFGASELMGGWPGVAGELKDGVLVYNYTEAHKGGEYKFILNGGGVQTADSEVLLTAAEDGQVIELQVVDGVLVLK